MAVAPTASPPVAQGNKLAKALFEYVRAEDNELSFKEGDIITVTKIDDSGWWEGECNGMYGMFPGNFVQLMDGVAPPTKPKQRRCVAVYEFNATGEDELSIKEGETLIIISEAEGWILGENKTGTQGLFPANYVQETTDFPRYDDDD